jgi:hypothetical protein
VQGVKRTVEEIESRKIHLGELCTAHREENVRLSQDFTAFLEKQNEVSSCHTVEEFILFSGFCLSSKVHLNSLCINPSNSS